MTPRWVTLTLSVLAGWVVHAIVVDNIWLHSGPLLYSIGLSTHINEPPLIIVRILAEGIALFCGYLVGKQFWVILNHKSLYLNCAMLLLLIVLFLLFNIRFSQVSVHPSF